MYMEMEMFISLGFHMNETVGGSVVFLFNIEGRREVGTPNQR